MSGLYEQIKADLGYLKLDAAVEMFATLARQARVEDQLNEWITDRNPYVMAGVILHQLRR